MIKSKMPITRHIIIKMQKVKDKEGILKAAREKQLATYKRVPIRLPAEKLATQKGLARNILNILKR